VRALPVRWVDLEQFRWVLEKANGNHEDRALMLLKACAWLSGKPWAAWRLAAEPHGKWMTAYSDLFEYLRLFLAAGLSVDQAIWFGREARHPSLEWFELVSSKPSLRRVVRTRFFADLARGRGADPERVALLEKYVDGLSRGGDAWEAFRLQAEKVADSGWGEDLLRGIATRLRRYLPKGVREKLLDLARRERQRSLEPEPRYVLPLAQARSATDRAALEGFVRHPDWMVRAVVAENPALPHDLMLVLARDPERAVLRALAARQDLPPEVYRVLEAAGVALSVERAGGLDRVNRGWLQSMRYPPASPPDPGPSTPDSRTACVLALARVLAVVLRKRAGEELVRLLVRRLTCAVLPFVRAPQGPGSPRAAQVAWVLGMFWKKAAEAIRARRYGIPGGRWLARIESAVLNRCGFLALYVKERPGGYLCTVLCRGGERVSFWLLPDGPEPDFGSLSGRPGDLVLAALLVHAACVVADLVARRDPEPSSPGRRAGAGRGLSRRGGASVRVVLAPRCRSGGGQNRGRGGSGGPSVGGYVPWHFRRLHAGWTASPEARANALYYAGVAELPEGITFVRPYCRAGSDPGDRVVISRLARSLAVSLDAIW